MSRPCSYMVSLVLRFPVYAIRLYSALPVSLLSGSIFHVYGSHLCLSMWYLGAFPHFYSDLCLLRHSRLIVFFGTFRGFSVVVFFIFACYFFSVQYFLSGFRNSHIPFSSSPLFVYVFWNSGSICIWCLSVDILVASLGFPPVFFLSFGWELPPLLGAGYHIGAWIALSRERFV